LAGDRLQSESHRAVRREADIQFGLGILALVASATGSWWLLQGCLHPIVWLGVAGALALAGTFLSEGRRTRNECARLQPQDALAPVVTLAPFRPVEQGGPPTLRPRLLGFLVFGIVASVGGSGVNVLLRLVTRGGAGTLDLLAWVLFTFPIALAVWMLPPRGLGINEGAGDQRKGGNNRPVGSESPQGPCPELGGDAGSNPQGGP